MNAETVKQIEMELRAYLGAAQDREKRDNILHKSIADLLREKYQGKKLTKRLATQFKERLPEAWREKAVVYYGEQYGLCELMVWGIPGSENYEQRVVFFLAHKGEKSDCFDIATFDHNDACHGHAAEKRIEKRAELCQGDDLPKIAEFIAVVENAREQLEKLTDYGTPGEQVRYAKRLYNVTHLPRND